VDLVGEQYDAGLVNSGKPDVVEVSRTFAEHAQHQAGALGSGIGQRLALQLLPPVIRPKSSFGMGKSQSSAVTCPELHLGADMYRAGRLSA